MRRPEMASVPHLPWIHQHLMGVVTVVLRHGRMVLVRPAGRLMESSGWRTSVVNRASVLVMV